MGKKQHSKDRMFITSTEWATEWGGAKRAAATPFKRLPFYCCALTFTPFEEAVCTDEGHVFDILHIVPYIQKFGKNPVTGKPLTLKGLHKLNFHKNADGEFQCPVLNKVFTEFTHIVAIKSSGNVFCYDAVKELNIKPKNWKELLTDEPFTRADIITLQDPNKDDARLLTDFDFVRKEISLKDIGLGVGEDEEMTVNTKAAGGAIRRALDDLSKSGSAALRLGGGGSKAQREAAAALAAIEAEKERVAAAAARKAAAAVAAAAGAASKSSAPSTEKAAGSDAGGAGGAGAAAESSSAAGAAAESAGDRDGGTATADGGDAASTAADVADLAEKGEGKGVGKGKGKQQEQRGKKGGTRGEKQEAKVPAMSVVDAASASVSGRSASAAKSSDEKKTAARVAAYAAGERVPVAENSKMVRSKFTSGATTRGFTSTVYTPVTTTEYEMVRVEKNPKKKGYCRVHTTHGDLNLELHCDLTPRTCENFLTLAARSYYDGTVFHRSIRNFMIQGGDPTGTGKGGQSVWGKPFKDELDSRLQHSERGVVSMANSGPHSNGSQFFILFKSAPHLNFKHTVFARVVGGMETLSKMERVPVDDDDRPQEEIKITGVTIFVNPYTEEDEDDDEGAKAGKAELTFEEQQEQERVGAWFSNPVGASNALPERASGREGGVGRYLRAAAATPSHVRGGVAGAAGANAAAGRRSEGDDSTVAPPVKKQKPMAQSRGGGYGNFDAW